MNSAVAPLDTAGTGTGASDAGISTEALDGILAAFNRNATDAIMAYFAEDARFDTTAGADADGRSFYGKEAIRAAFDGLFNSVERIEWEPLDVRIVGDKAYCELHRRATMPGGEVQDWLAIDVLTFKDGLMVRKSSYAKRRG